MIDFFHQKHNPNWRIHFYRRMSDVKTNIVELGKAGYQIAQISNAYDADGFPNFSAFWHRTNVPMENHLELTNSESAIEFIDQCKRKRLFPLTIASYLENDELRYAILCQQASNRPASAIEFDVPLSDLDKTIRRYQSRKMRIRDICVSRKGYVHPIDILATTADADKQLSAIEAKIRRHPAEARQYFSDQLKAKGNLQPLLINEIKCYTYEGNNFATANKWNEANNAFQMAEILTTSYGKQFGFSNATRNWQYTGRYNLACVYAKSNKDNKLILNTLKAAVDKGFSSLKILSKDRDEEFASVKNTEEFRQIFDVVKKRSQRSTPKSR